MRMRLNLVLLLTGLISIPGSGLAQGLNKSKEDDRIHTVVYSYQKWSRQLPARYVLVATPAVIKQAGLADRVRALFKFMMAGKRNSYGDARLGFQKDFDKTGIVYVFLDKKKKDYHPIVMSETVYTFTENGASRVIFPEINAKGWGRADVPYPAYVFTLPLWQSLPPAEMTAAMVRTPEGQAIDAKVALDGLKAHEPNLIKAVWAYLDAGGQPARAAAKAAIELRLPGLAEQLVGLLQSGDPILRGLAIEGLDGVDTDRANRALRTVMDEDPSDALRDQAALVLGKSKNPTYSAAAHYQGLRSEDPKIIIASAEALAMGKQVESRTQLIAVLPNANSDVRAAVVTSLLNRGDEQALVSELTNADLTVPIRVEIARALSERKEKRSKYPALIFLAVNGPAADAADAARNLVKFPEKKTFAALGKSLSHEGENVRVTAAQSLAKIGKKDGLKALANVEPQDVATRNAMMTAMRTLYGNQKLDFVLKGTKEKNSMLQRSAVSALGILVATGKRGASKKKVYATLRTLAQSDDAQIRAAAVHSFEAIGKKDVRGDLTGLAGDQAIEVRRAVAHALRDHAGEDTEGFLLKYAKEEDPELLANALESLGILGNIAARDLVLAQLRNSDVRVRRAATGALTALGAKLSQKKPLLSYFSEQLFDEDSIVRKRAVIGLQLVDDPRIITAMAALIQDPDSAVKQATLEAMAKTNHPSAVDAIAGALEDDDVVIRKAAIEALVALKQKAGAQVLRTYLDRERADDLRTKAEAGIKSLESL